jgi:uncharacterized protein YggE
MNLQKRAWQVGIFAGVVLSVYLVALAVGQLKSIAYIGSGIAATNTISVTGTGDAYAVPDVATFSFGVTQTSKTVTDAQSKATAKIAAALKAVRDAGVKDEDIQTTNYSINPHYEYQNAVCPAATNGSVSYCPPGKSVLTGYDVSETITVKVRDLNKAGDIFASIGSLEVENINGLDFSVDKPADIQADARGKAIADAQSKAGQLASQLGVRLVRVVNFSEDNGGSYPRPMYAMAGVASVSDKAAAPEIPAGQQKVTSNVTVTYEIQ